MKFLKQGNDNLPLGNSVQRKFSFLRRFSLQRSQFCRFRCKILQHSSLSGMKHAAYFEKGVTINAVLLHQKYRNHGRRKEGGREGF